MAKSHSGSARAKRGVRAEKSVARKMSGHHVGGPGKPDIRKGTKPVENKHWKAPVHTGVLKKAKRGGVKQVNASGAGGYTKPAQSYAKKQGIKLTRRKAW